MSTPMKVFVTVVVLVALLSISIGIIIKVQSASKDTIETFSTQSTKILGGEATT